MRVGVASSKSTISALALYSALGSCDTYSFDLGHPAGLLAGFLDAADHVERLLGHVVTAALHDLLEALDRVGELNIAPRLAGKRLGHAERLREEALDPAGARHGELVLVGELLHAEDGDDVLEILVALER